MLKVTSIDGKWAVLLQNSLPAGDFHQFFKKNFLFSKQNYRWPHKTNSRYIFRCLVFYKILLGYL